MDDIEREAKQRERAKLKETVVTDINEVFNNVLIQRKTENKIKKEKRKW